MASPYTLNFDVIARFRAGASSGSCKTLVGGTSVISLIIVQVYGQLLWARQGFPLQGSQQLY